jgi:hypothetical protein
MWLTGVDAPSLDTMYVDKPMRGHGQIYVGIRFAPAALGQALAGARSRSGKRAFSSPYGTDAASIAS